MDKLATRLLALAVALALGPMALAERPRSSEAIERASIALPELGVMLSPDGRVIEGPSGTGSEPNHPSFSIECLQSSIWFLDHGPSALLPELPPFTGAPVVAILDGAVDAGHPLLRARFVGGDDFVDGDGSPALPAYILADTDRLRRPGNLHATAVAGLVASLAPEASLAVYRVLDEECLGTAFDLAQGIVQAVNDGASVILLPLGSHQGSSAVRRAIDFAVDQDVLVVAAAGNDHNTSKPARIPGVLAVAAVDGDLDPAPFTAWGPHIDLADLGVALVVGLPGDRQAEASGTSLSAARTAGAAARLRMAVPTLTGPEVQALLEATARPIETNARIKLGAGLTDVEAALRDAELP